jgi:hypothetical protein
MWEARRSWHCEYCDNELCTKDSECPRCWLDLYHKAVKDALRELSPEHPLLESRNFTIKWNAKKGCYERCGD